MAGMEVDQIMGFLRHELHHLINRHASRATAQGVTDATHIVWNVAADYEVNVQITRDHMVKLPPGGLMPEHEHQGDSAEQHWRRLMNSAPPQACPQSGSGADGIPKPWEQTGTASGAPANGLNVPGVSGVQSDQLIRATAEAVKQAGMSPGDELRKWATGVLAPKVIDWWQVLAATARNAVATVRGSTDYSYGRVNRRQAAYGRVVMPSMVDNVPNILIIADTSGSMSESDLAEVMHQTKRILQSLDALTHVTVLAVDTMVHVAQTVYDAKQIKLVGGGGTNMGTGIVHAGTVRPAPDIVIVMTDGYTSWPQAAPPFKTIILLVGRRARRSGTPAWAKVITTAEVDND
jgi:predicted metal-dependent peptidase